MAEVHLRKPAAPQLAGQKQARRHRRATRGRRRTPLPRTPLQRLAQLALSFPVNPALPRDGAANHDHYLYGAAKRT